MRSDPLQAPDYAPTLPVYGVLDQIIRTSGPAIVGTNVYPGWICQYAGSLTLRDRTPCYVTEPNGVVLGPGYYDCRLVDSYAGLPLFATTCCVSGAFPSSSSSSSSA